MVRKSRAIFSLSAALIASVSGAAFCGVKPPAKASTSAVTPNDENRFVTVEEFVKGKRAPHTAVSVEGYALLGLKTSDGGLRLVLTDSVDHVMSAKDADSVAKSGALGIVPLSALKAHASWAWTAKGAEKYTLYTGATHAQKVLHDSVAKVRLTGWATGKSISPVTSVEYQDENGDWKNL